VFKWLKGRGEGASGPDFSSVDSREKAEALFRSGKLHKLFLMPPEFGGHDIAHNVVFVPAFAAELKVRTDQNVVIPLAQQGKVTRYQATPEYEGKSFIPTAINIVASEPESFTFRIAVWGKALDEQGAPA